jgi:NAD-dependent SIR2 family protein deacetylase
MRREPTAVVDWRLFSQTPLPYLEVRRPFILGINRGQWKPSVGHLLIDELAKRGSLARLYSCNIDGLEHQLRSVPKDKIVNCHGSLGQASCEGCGAVCEMGWFIERVQTQIKDIYSVDVSAPETSTPIVCLQCRRPLVKPSTVLYGRNLPSSFFEAMEEDFPDGSDLVVVMGTSLTVAPANRVPGLARHLTPRIIINNEPVGAELGIEYAKELAQQADGRWSPAWSRAGRDYFLSGQCDETVQQLASRLGWYDVLRHAKSATPDD